MRRRHDSQTAISVLSLNKKKKREAYLMVWHAQRQHDTALIFSACDVLALYEN